MCIIEYMILQFSFKSKRQMLAVIITLCFHYFRRCFERVGKDCKFEYKMEDVSNTHSIFPVYTMITEHDKYYAIQFMLKLTL